MASFFRCFRVLFCFLVAAAAREWTLKKHEKVFAVPVLLACARFCAPLKKKKTDTQIRRKTNRKNNKNEPARNTKTHQKHTKQSPKWLPGGCFGGSGSLLGARSAPRASQNRLRRPPGTKKIFGRGRGRPKTISQPFLAPLKTDTHPGRGGHEIVPHLVKLHSC